MKKFIVFLLIIFVAMLGLVYFKLFSSQSNYYRTINSTSNSVLVLNNFDLGKIRIVTTDKDSIIFDLTGDPAELAGLEHESDLLLSKFGVARDWSGISGTIYVPEGILLDITLSKDAMVRLSDLGGEQSMGEQQSFLVDTSGLNSIQTSGSGEILLDAWGDVIIWDDEKWEVITKNSGDGGDNANDESPSSDPIYCGVGSQAIRDYCCVIEEAEAQVPFCDAFGHWVFSNVKRACDYACDPLPEVDSGEEGGDQDCGVGGQGVRNTCCADQHVGEYQGCLGVWKYNNASQSCNFDCDSNDPPAGDSGEGSGDGGTVSYGDSTSDYCATINNEDDQNLCCNDILKNNLSSGPRPGFPDCIGTWNFDIKAGCAFECAEQAEMIRILNELRQNAQN